MINHSRRNFLKASLVSTLAVSVPFTLTNSKIIKEEVIDYSFTVGQKALAYGLSTSEIISSYLAISGIWIADVLFALMAFIVFICSIIVSVIVI